jgi:Calpain large subunit, domain III
VCKTVGSKSVLSFTKSNFVAVSQFLREPQVTIELLVSNFRRYSYVIVPTCVKPGSEGSYSLTVRATSPVSIDLRDLAGWHANEIGGEWKGPTAGGCRHYRTWRNNPRYHLYVNEATAVNVTLMQVASNNSEIANRHRSHQAENKQKCCNAKCGNSGPQHLDTCSGSNAKILSESDDDGVDDDDDDDGDGDGDDNVDGDDDGDGDDNSVNHASPVSVTTSPWYVSRSPSISANDGDTPTNLRVEPSNFSPPSFTERPMSASVSLSQADSGDGKDENVPSLRSSKTDLHWIGLYIAQPTPSGVLLGHDILHKTRFRPRRQASLSVHLEASEHPYLVIPSTYEPHRENSFLISTHSDAPVRFEPAPAMNWSTYNVQGAWISGKTAGGCRQHASWKRNPKFLLEVKETTRILPVLNLVDTGDQEAYLPRIGFYVLRSSQGQQDCDESFDDEVYVSQFLEKYEVAPSDAITLHPNEGPFVLLPSTKAPGRESLFQISVMSDRPIDVQSIR